MAPRWMRFLLFLTYAGRVLVAAFLLTLLAGGGVVRFNTDRQVPVYEVSTPDGSYTVLQDRLGDFDPCAPVLSARTGSDASCSFRTAGTATVARDAGDDDVRLTAFFSALPLAVVLYLAMALVAGVIRTTMTGDPFRPETVLRLRRLAWLIGLGGLLADLLGTLIASLRFGDGFRLHVSLGWVTAGMLIMVAAEIVRLGVLRSQQAAAPAGPVDHLTPP